RLSSTKSAEALSAKRFTWAMNESRVVCCARPSRRRGASRYASRCCFASTSCIPPGPSRSTRSSTCSAEPRDSVTISGLQAALPASTIAWASLWLMGSIGSGLLGGSVGVDLAQAELLLARVAERHVPAGSRVRDRRALRAARKLQLRVVGDGEEAAGAELELDGQRDRRLLLDSLAAHLGLQRLRDLVELLGHAEVEVPVLELRGEDREAVRAFAAQAIVVVVIGHRQSFVFVVVGAEASLRAASPCRRSCG